MYYDYASNYIAINPNFKESKQEFLALLRHELQHYEQNLAMQGIAAVALAVVALLLVLVVSNNNVFTYDLTAQKRFTLSPFTEQTVKKLKKSFDWLADIMIYGTLIFLMAMILYI